MRKRHGAKNYKNCKIFFFPLRAGLHLPVEAMSRKIVVLLFHPRLEDSRVNAQLAKAALGISNVTVRDMYDLYPTFHVNVSLEKQVLLEHDIIVWQHPFYWYNCPPLMKQWIDLVLEFGWAYGQGGNALNGKWILNALSSGGTFEVYRKDGRNRFTYRELLSPFDQTAFLCRMKYLPPFIVPGANTISRENIDAYEIAYAEYLHFLSTAKFDVEALMQAETFNSIHAESWQEAFYKPH